MPAAVRTPIAATLPASSTAWPTGSVLPLRAAGAGRGRCACARGAGFLAVPLLAVVRFFGGVVCFARAVVARLSLLRPGRERGRLPRTPGSSSRSGATTRENTGRSGLMRAYLSKSERGGGSSVNVAAGQPDGSSSANLRALSVP